MISASSTFWASALESKLAPHPTVLRASAALTSLSKRAHCCLSVRLCVNTPWAALCTCHPARKLAPPPAWRAVVMGAGFSYLYHRVFGGGEYKVVMVGLDNAGKSTILYRLCGTASAAHTPLRHRPRPRLLARAGTWAT